MKIIRPEGDVRLFQPVTCMLFLSVLQRARCCFCFGDDPGEESKKNKESALTVLSPPPVCVHMHRRWCLQRGSAHCYSSARSRMVRKYWSANRDDVTVTRRVK